MPGGPRSRPAAPGRSWRRALFWAARAGKRLRRGTGSVAVVLDETTRKLLDGKNFATVATVNPDGGPQASVVWILRER